MKLFARDALLPTGWAHDVVVDVGANGVIRAVDVAFAVPADAEHVQGPLVPGMPNVHSHAFQRALAGLTERGGPSGDNFWTWRTEMYRFLERVGPDEQEAVATQLYLELLKGGYTSVGEFHYLHHDPAGRPYANPAEMAERIGAAADATGIGLTLLPVFYAHSDFGGAAPLPAQRRHRARGCVPCCPASSAPGPHGLPRERIRRGLLAIYPIATYWVQRRSASRLGVMASNCACFYPTAGEGRRNRLAAILRARRYRQSLRSGLRRLARELPLFDDA